MVSDSDLVARLREILTESDLDTATAGSVRKQLEEDFGVDLSDRKGFVRDQIDVFLETLNQENEKEEHAPESENDVLQEDDDDGEEEGSQTRRPSKAGKQAKKRGGGFQTVCSLSPQLQKVVGESKLARTEVVKKLWVYIKEKDLQDPTNKRNIICDELLNAIFRVKSINMFQMNKALTKHIWPLSEDDAQSDSAKMETKSKEAKEKAQVDSAKTERKSKNARERAQVDSAKTERKSKKARKRGATEVEQKEKRQKKGASGFLAPLPLSDALVKFFATGENALSRADVVKRIWDYIKQNDLQDPSDKRKILCDEKLKELFEVESFNGFAMTKLLTTHFIKLEQ